MRKKLIYFIALILLMFITGIYVGTWLTIILSLKAFTAQEFIHIGNVIAGNISLLMKILMPISIFILLLCLWFYRFKKGTGFYLGISSLVFLFITILINTLVLNPIEKEIHQLSLTFVASGWEGIRNKWQLFYGLRALTSLISYGLFSWFVLAAMRKNKIANY